MDALARGCLIESGPRVAMSFLPESERLGHAERSLSCEWVKAAWPWHPKNVAHHKEVLHTVWLVQSTRCCMIPEAKFMRAAIESARGSAKAIIPTVPRLFAEFTSKVK